MIELGAQTTAAESARKATTSPAVRSPHIPLADSIRASASARRVPCVPLTLSVTVASQRMPIRRLLQLAPGAILRFDQSCRATLSLEVQGRPLGQGIAVTIGPRLGLLLTEPVKPHHRRGSLR